MNITIEYVKQLQKLPNGKFVHIMDIEGNKIELWEPNYNYGKTGKEKTK